MAPAPPCAPACRRSADFFARQRAPGRGPRRRGGRAAAGAGRLALPARRAAALRAAAGVGGALRADAARALPDAGRAHRGLRDLRLRALAREVLRPGRDGGRAGRRWRPTSVAALPLAAGSTRRRSPALPPGAAARAPGRGRHLRRAARSRSLTRGAHPRSSCARQLDHAPARRRAGGGGALLRRAAALLRHHRCSRS